jgi:hypothetical protein
VFQGLATRRELALERDDLVTYVGLCPHSRSTSASSHCLSLLRLNSAKRLIWADERVRRFPKIPFA